MSSRQSSNRRADERGATRLVLAGLLLLAPRLALGQSAPPATAPASGDAATLERARRYHEEGRVRYDLGDYAAAIESFTRAYELSLDPDLLFNIAQAHRLAGNCVKALESYRHFLRLDRDSPAREQAEAQVNLLRETCPPLSAAPAGPAPSPQPPPVDLRAPPPPADNVEPSRRSGLLVPAAVLAGVAATAAGSSYLWNSSRFDRWQAEDRDLRAQPPPTLEESELLARRQEANDHLARSIRRWDRFTVTSAAVGLLAAAAAAWLGFAR
jgi:tetratricopeptide (TPR) repeat protein